MVAAAEPEKAHKTTRAWLQKTANQIINKYAFNRTLNMTEICLQLRTDFFHQIKVSNEHFSIISLRHMFQIRHSNYCAQGRS